MSSAPPGDLKVAAIDRIKMISELGIGAGGSGKLTLGTHAVQVQS